jgi:hypothetical protein
MTAQTSTAVVPDCDDPEAPAWDIAGISSFGGKVTAVAASAASE